MDSLTPALLLVEDDADDLHLFQRALRQAGLGGDLRSTGTLASARDQLAGVDVVLCDLNLPDSHGLDTVDALRDIAPEVPLIVLTGVDDEALALEALRRGASDYLFKNELEPRRLSRSVLYALERARHERTRAAHDAALRELDRNRYVEQLAVELIGELSNILTRQMVLVEMVEEVDALEETRAHLSDIAETTRQASTLVGDLRSFVPSGGPRALIGLVDFLGRLEPELRAAMPDGVDLVIDTQLDDPDDTVLANETLLRNLVMRLVPELAGREPRPEEVAVHVAHDGDDGRGRLSFVARHRHLHDDGIDGRLDGLTLDQVIECAPQVLPRGARLRLRASQAELARIGGTLEISVDGADLVLRVVLPHTAASRT